MERDTCVKLCGASFTTTSELYVGVWVCLFVSIFVCMFVREIKVLRPINSINVRYFCKLCVLEKKYPHLSCERTIKRIVKKIRKRGSVVEKKKTGNLTILVFKWKQTPENIYAIWVLKIRFRILGHCRNTVYSEFPHSHRVRVFRIEDNWQIWAS
jgi:hypothetical protein